MIGLVGLGMGMLFPVTTVAIQNAVPPHQLGTTTGAMNFFRSLGGALAVSGFGAIILSGGAAHEGLTLAALAAEASHHRVDLNEPFRWLFVAAAGCIAVGLAFLFAMEERPLRGEAVHAPLGDHPAPDDLTPSTSPSA